MLWRVAQISLFSSEEKKPESCSGRIWLQRERERGGPAENANFFRFGIGGRTERQKNLKVSLSPPPKVSFSLFRRGAPPPRVTARPCSWISPADGRGLWGPRGPGGGGAANPTPPLISENFCEEGIPEGKKAPRDRRAKAFSFPTESRQWISLPPSRRPFLPLVRVEGGGAATRVL